MSIRGLILKAHARYRVVFWRVLRRRRAGAADAAVRVDCARFRLARREAARRLARERRVMTAERRLRISSHSIVEALRTACPLVLSSRRAATRLCQETVPYGCCFVMCGSLSSAVERERARHAWQAGCSGAGRVVLQPFPSWDMNREGDADALQSVLGFEIDPLDRVWILDQGKVNGSAAQPGAIKLVVWDIRQDVELIRYVFSDEEASLQDSFLCALSSVRRNSLPFRNDIVVDVIHNFAYITDSGVPANSSRPMRPGLLVFMRTRGWQEECSTQCVYLAACRARRLMTTGMAASEHAG